MISIVTSAIREKVEDIRQVGDLAFRERGTRKKRGRAQRKGGPKAKEIDQPLTTPRRSRTESEKFFRAAMDFKSGLREKPELVKVYEKISRGIWSYDGVLELKPVEKKLFGRIVELPHNRLIPTAVKVEVWRRDRGQCVECGSTKNLHFDHDIPFSMGERVWSQCANLDYPQDAPPEKSA